MVALQDIACYVALTMRPYTHIPFLASASMALARGNCAPVNCTKAAVAIPDAEIVSADFYANGEAIRLDLVPSCGGPDFIANVTADVCRVVVNVPTSDFSVVRVEAWLPAAEDAWNGRFLATGNGGIGGCIDYSTMQAGAQLKFAAFGTNAGHDGETGHDFFLGHPEVINDFGHRGIHIEAETGKKIIAAYYGRSQTKSYYQACSTGGRQGFQTAHLYPDDFDGMLLGAPGVDWLHIVASKGILARRIGWPDFESSAYVRPEQWKAIVAKQIELFDGLDGVVDGVIDDPTSIRFDPELLACGTGHLNETLCLKPAQVLSVRAAYQPLTDTKGNIVYPPFEIGSNTAVFSENQVNGTDLQYRVLDVSRRDELPKKDANMIRTSGVALSTTIQAGLPTTSPRKTWTLPST
jgi:feruloyl esterase